MTTVNARAVNTARRGRYRRRSPRAAARAVGLPTLIVLAGALVATVPNYAFAGPVPVGGLPPTSACQNSSTTYASASASTSPSASASPSGSVSAFGPSSASGSQSPTTSATASASATSATPAAGQCGVKKPVEPTATVTRSPSAVASSTSRRPASPSRSAAPPASGGSTVSAGSPGSEQALPPVVGQEPYGPITRAQIIQRALAWISQQVPYSQTSWWVDSEGSYRQDCSGYVSMAWGLDQAIDFWTGNLDTVSHSIPGAQLLPGDILLSSTHTVLFAGWADSAHTTFDFYEESHPGTVAHYVTGASLSGYLDAGFVPYRYDGVTGSNVGPFSTPTAGIPIGDLGPLARELAPEGSVVQQPTPAWWQTVPAPGSPSAPTHASSAAVREAELEPAAAEMPEQEAGAVGVAVGGSALLFAGLSLAMTRRRTVRVVSARPRRRH